MEHNSHQLSLQMSAFNSTFLAAVGFNYEARILYESSPLDICSITISL